MEDVSFDTGNLVDDILRKPHSRCRYKAKIASVSPDRMRVAYEREANCLLGISLENSNFSRPKLESMLIWITRRFRHCSILIGDSIHRITLETTRGLSPETALQEGLILGRNFIDDNSDLIDSYNQETIFEYETCSSIQNSYEYELQLRHLWNCFSIDSKFRCSVENFAKDYHRKQWNNLEDEERIYRISRSCEYFLEEFAVFACLKRRGHSVMIYPGSFSTLQEIAEGLHPKICAELRALTTVSLQLKRR